VCPASSFARAITAVRVVSGRWATREFCASPRFVVESGASDKPMKSAPILRKTEENEGKASSPISERMVSLSAGSYPKYLSAIHCW